MTDAHADVSKHAKIYLLVFVLLLAGTVLTVAASRVDFHGQWNVVIAVLIAAFKASLVAAIFMHLRWEKGPSVWWLLCLCAVFLLALLLLPVLTVSDLPPQVTRGSWG